MANSTTARAREVIAELDQFEVDMHLVNTWVHGADNLTVQLGGVSTPTIQNLVKNFKLSAQEILNAAEYIQDNYEGLEDIIDANREYAEIAETLLLKIANWMALDLATMNQMNIDRYNDWYAHGIEKIAEVGLYSGQMKQAVRDMIAASDESIAQHRLQLRLMNNTNPNASAKPVLFIIAGQSNAQGSCDLGKYESAADIGQFWAWNESPPYFKPLKDPVYHSSSGSAWPAFARRVFALTGRKVLILNVAFGGSAVTDGGYDTSNTWADNGYGTCREQAKNAYDAMKAYCVANAIEYDLGGMLWIQGEAEIARLVAGTITLQDYKDGTEDVFGWFRTEFDSLPDLKIFVSEIGSSSSWENNPNNIAYKNYVRQVRQALREVVADDEKTGVAYSLALEFVKCGYVSNNTIHYSQEGYNLVGDAFARYAVHECNL